MLATILGITNWCLNFVAIVIFLIIIITAIKYRRDMRDVSLMLTYNTCMAALLACLASCLMITSNLSNGFLIYNLDFCITWGLFYDIFQCSIYHSYYLQGFYRLCRVVFYKKKSLLSCTLFTMLMIGQWSLTLCLLLPPVFLHWYVHLPTEQYCLVPYTDLFAESYHISVIYMIPLVCIFIVYIWITVFIRTSSRASAIALAANQRQRNLRDLTVIRRIIILISALIALRFPTVIFMIYAVAMGHLYRWTFAIVGLITAVCMISLGLIMIQITPQLRNNICVFILHRANRVFTQQTPQQHATVPTMTGGRVVVTEQNKLPSVQRQTGPV